jgi:hypothetical protein
MGGGGGGGDAFLGVFLPLLRFPFPFSGVLVPDGEDAANILSLASWYLRSFSFLSRSLRSFSSLRELAALLLLGFGSGVADGDARLSSVISGL